MVLGFTFYGMLVMFFSHYINRIAVTIGIMISYIVLIVGLHTDVDNKIPMLFLNNYIVLHNAFASLKNWFVIIFAIEVVLCLFMMLIIRKYWFVKIGFKNWKIINNGILKWHLKMLLSKRNLTVIIVLTMLIVVFRILSAENLTFYDLLVLQFWGHGTGYFYLMDFLHLLVYNGIPIYLLCCFLEKENYDRSVFLIIRLGTNRDGLCLF